MNQLAHPRILVLNRNLKIHIIIRKISKYIHKEISSKSIRQNYLDYFINEKQHTFVKSSPVIPFCDPTVPFVNAGMNQFKSIFLGTQSPHFTQVTNSQKCIRVGGKHNDINIVGKDGYHLTFFEMLGNWSFGEYFKEDACKMAWELLTQIYKIPPSRLYVTYFGGDKELGIPDDTEVRDIWHSIGVKDDRILSFNTADNFWEMGLTGPCGPCTEIHFDHLGSINRSEFVNKNLHDLTELWNLVFIQYNRLPNGSIIPLPKKHVDTGLGLERLCCALQGKLSTYDTDLFDYLIRAIEKNCSNIQKYNGKFGEHDWNDLDTSYRILADHMRMLTVCLADGVIPEQNQKLRRVIRKCFVLGETIFEKNNGLVKELSNYVVENLGDTYPELERNINQIHQIIDYEEEVYAAIRTEAKKDWDKFAIGKNLPIIDSIDITPSFIKAFKELYTMKPKEIDADLSHKLYDTHGFDTEGIEQLAQILNINFNPEVFHKKMEEIKLKSKSGRQITIDNLINTLTRKNIKATDDSWKYDYKKIKDNYIFPNTECEVIQIIDKDESLSEATNATHCGLILDKTNFYNIAGGQESDKGKIRFSDSIFHVESLWKIKDILIHNGYFEGDLLKIGAKGKTCIDESVRLNNMQNHTATHLLNTVIKQVKIASCQKSSRVTRKFLNLDISVFGPKLNLEDIKKIEQIMNDAIKKELEVRISTTDSQGLYSFDKITLIPGETYPDNDVRLVEIGNMPNIISREPCCGTHVVNTGDLEDFSIISLKSLGRCSSSIYAVTGKRAKLARKNAADLLEDIMVFKKSLTDHLDKPEILDMGVMALKERLKYEVDDDQILPYIFKCEILEELNGITKQIKHRNNEDLKNFIDMEMYDALENRIQHTKSNKKYLVHYLRSSMMFESVPLQKATAVCLDIPIIVISYSDGLVKARCCVPQNLEADGFNAENWLGETVASVFDSKITRQKLQNGVFVCNMKAKKINMQEWHNLLAQSLDNAKNYIHNKL